MFYHNHFFQPIEKNVLPQSLTHLTFDTYFNQPIEEEVLPQSITHLTFGYSGLTTTDKNIIIKYNKKLKFINDNHNNDDNIELIFWKYSLDIGYGCVWNPLAIKNIERINKI